MSFLSLPEELQERILATLIPSPTKPQWLRSPNSHTTRLAPIYVSRQLNRIATPLLYQSIYLSSPSSSRLLLQTLLLHPELQTHVRCIVAAGVWSPVIRVLSLCTALHVLDLTIAFDDDDHHADSEAVALAPPCGNGIGDDVGVDPFSNLAQMRHLTLRKPSNTYLSLARLRALIIAIAHAIRNWPDLRTADIAFKLADDTPTSPSSSSSSSPFSVSPFALSTTHVPIPIPAHAPAHTGPISALASALSSSPALHTFSTHLPSVWNTAIATIATNPALQRIVLSDGRGRGPDRGRTAYAHAHGYGCAHNASNAYGPHTASGSGALPAIPTYHQAHTHSQGITGTGLFLMEARRHPRLAELIAVGTPIVRGRAHTLGGAGAGSSVETVGSTLTSCQGASAGAGTTTSTSPSKPNTNIGLGLRIDTSSAVTAVAARIPVGPGPGSAVSAGGTRIPMNVQGQVNPAWMGPPLSSGGAGAGAGRGPGGRGFQRGVRFGCGGRA